MQITQVKLDAIIPYAFNNRTHPEEQINRIANSISEFGFNQPLVLDDKNTILVGHGRFLAAKKLGLVQVPCYALKGLNETKKKAYRILDNKLQNDSSWEFDNLKIELDLLETEGFELEPWGLDSLKDLYPEVDPEVIDDGGAGELPEDPFIKRGDLIELGKHRVLCGDSISAEDVKYLLDGKAAELLFTSPPYSDMREYGGGDMSIAYISDFIKTFSKYTQYLIFNLGIQRKDHSIVQYWNDYIDKAISQNMLFLAWNVWWKNNISIGQQTAFTPIEHEWVFIFGRDFKDINRTIDRKTSGKLADSILRRQPDGTLRRTGCGLQMAKKEMGSVFQSNAEIGVIRKEHPATFPIEFPSEYIKAITNQNDIVIDPFLGSGTTLIACEQLNRICYGMEIGPKYCQVIINRYFKYCKENNKVFSCKVNGSEYTPDYEKENGPSTVRA